MAKKASKSAASEKNNRKLSDSELEAYKDTLTALRDRIRGDVSTMTDAALNSGRTKGGVPLHMADLGTDNFEQEQTLAFIQSDSKVLLHIDEALGKIKDGTYGICEDCGVPIPKARLNVLPYTALCVKCVESAHENTR